MSFVLRGIVARAALLLAALSLAPGPRSTAAETPVTSPFNGTWLGSVAAPNATTEIGFAFRPTEKGLITTFHMPAMFVHRLTLGPARVEDRTVEFKPLEVRLALSADGSRLSGTFGPARLPVELKRGGTFSPAPPAPTYPAAPPPRWSVALGAEVWATPVARDDAIYLGTVDGKFHARSARDGHELWTWSGPHAIYGSALATGERVYFVDAKCDLVCLDRAAGFLAWRRPLHDEKLAGGPAPENPTFNHRTPTPLLVGETRPPESRGRAVPESPTLYVGSTDGGLYALDAATGAVRWRHETKTQIFASVGLDPDGRTLWIGGLDGTVLALDRETRREIARTKLPGAVVSTPVRVGANVAVGCRDYLLYGLTRADLSVAWRFSFWFSWVESTPAVVDGMIYVGGSDFARVTALDPATGRANWSRVVHGLTWGTPLVVGETVYAGSSAQRSAIIPHTGGLMAIDRATGAVKWRHVVGAAVDRPAPERSGYLGSPALAGDAIVVAGFDGTLTAFPLRP